MKTNKLWSLMMMLTLVLGTAIAFSSCSKDDDNDNNASGNCIVVNGIKAGIASCRFVSNRLEFTIQDGVWEGEIEVEPVSGDFKNGVMKVEIEGGMEKLLDGSGECGFYFNNAPCTINMTNNTISFSATSLTGTLKQSGLGKIPTTATINYNGILVKSSK